MSTNGHAAGGLVKASRGGLVLAVYAALLLAASMALPWWRMENRAPQYGMRVLVVDVSPWGVKGDVFEIDNLGHYVGIPKMESLAQPERALAPYVMPLTVLCALALPFLRRGKLRLALTLAVAAVPLGFALDLWFWQRYAVTNLDPNAALNMIADRIRSQVWGKYSVAQFQVHAMFQSGFWLAVVAAANALGFLYAERRGPSSAAAERSGLRPAGAAAVLALMLGGAAQAATLEVGPGSPYRSIGAAVAAAAPGDEVLVRAGLYRENVTIAQPLVLRGEPGAVLDGGGQGTVVLVKKGPSAVRGLTVRGSGDSFLYEDSGIKLDGAADCTVEGNRVEDSLFGILARTSPRVRVLGNHVVGKDLPLPRRGDGIRLQDAAGSLVEGNTIQDSRDLAIWQSHRCVVRKNRVRGGRYGLHYMYCDDNVFEDNVFEDNHTGGAIMYSRRLELRRNRFTGSRGPSAYGLLIKVGDDVVAEQNWFVDNTIGIFLEDSPSSLRSSCTIRNNVIGGNETGLGLQPSVSRVLFHGNAFLANRLQVEVYGRARNSGNRWSHEGRGNYWSDYVGFDADGDGTGDTAYRVEQFFEGMTERWPGAGLLRMGPAAEALEMAVRAFPIMQPQALVTDEHPLLAPPEVIGRPPEAAPRPVLAGAGLLSLAVSVLALGSARAFGLGGRS
ncbi:MAG TPA: nitrous oxide reductase family maturation protein NosD [Thermoanaerobaculia bacterium]|nr:nitrous oxide reductase family maturation protein NosD [Thermoanaerobaculia bacterium]